MAKLYKLTDVDRYTRNNTKWGKNVTHTTDGSGELCGPGWLHAYTDPLLAVLLNPIHCGYSRFRLWEAEGEIGKNDKGLKVGTRSLTTIREIPIPKITTKQKIRFAILCAMAVYKDQTWTDWANNWLSGKDRSAATAVVAAEAAEAAAVVAVAAYAAAAAEAAAAAAVVTAYGAEAAAVVAAEVAASKTLDLIAIAHKAVDDG
jgi:hypothetical protein